MSSLSEVPRGDLEAGFDSLVLLNDNMATRLDALTTLAVMALDSGTNALPANLVLSICQAGGNGLDDELERRWNDRDKSE